MTKFKRTMAGISALTFSMGLAACGNTSNDPGTTEAPKETTTAATVEINTKPISDEQQDLIDNTADLLRDVELENKTVKWLCHWDINPDSTGKSEPVALSMFKSKYGAEIKWYQTTWDTRYSDLSTYVLGGEGIDFFQRDPESLPKGVINGMFQAVDDYIDLDSELWAPMKPAMENYNFNGKHYAFIQDVIPNNVVLYSAKTIEENGYDDPWDLFQQGKWNWDTFTNILEDFVDPEGDRYGLDGWWTEGALYMSAGAPAVSSVNGKLTVNLTDPRLDKAMAWMLSLYNKGLVLDKAQFDWSEQPQFMGEGKEIFFICGAYQFQGAPETWATKIAPEDARMVPVPSPADSEPYQWAAGSGYCLCKGAGNPLGVALYVECEVLANGDPEAKEVYSQQCREDFQWNETLIEQYYACIDFAKTCPVTEHAAGVSNDVASITTDGGEQAGLRAALHGYDWSTTREEITAVVELLVGEADQQLQDMAS